MKDKFDLEQQILVCWAVIDDIKAFAQSIDKNQEIVKVTDISKFLNSLVTIYDFKFTKLFELYENVLKDMQ